RGGERTRIAQLPATLIRNEQRQTAIRPTSARLRHPRPADRRRVERRRVLAGGESDQWPVWHVRLVAHRIPESLSQKPGSRHAAAVGGRWNSDEITNPSWVSAVAGHRIAEPKAPRNSLRGGHIGCSLLRGLLRQM